MRRPARFVAALALLLFTGGLSLAGPATAHPYHLEISNEITGNNDLVDALDWVAQSIVPTSRFFVSRVSLLVSDVGPNDSLTVSIRTDSVGLPSTTVLSQGMADGPVSPTWVDFNLSPYVELGPLTTYWIVAQSPAPIGEGYDWLSSPNNLAYPLGTGARSSDGISWSNRGRDYTFRVYGFVQPGFTFSVGLANPVLRVGGNEVFAVNFTNSGPGASEALWVNMSLPASLAYVSDDAASLGGTRTGSYSFSFANINPGSYTFNVTITPTGATPDGTVAVTAFLFDAEDHNGAPLVRSQLQVAATIQNARLAISLGPTESAVDPGDMIAFNATIENVGRERASNILFEAPIDSNTTYLSSAPPATYDTTSRNVLRAIPFLTPGTSLSVNWTIRVNVGVPDLAQVLSEVIVTYVDPTGAILPREKAAVLALARAPVFAPVLMFNSAAAERGEEIVATLYYNNTGSVAAPDANATWSLGGHYELVALDPALPYVQTPTSFTVRFTNVSSDSHALRARLRVLRSLDDGLLMPIQVVWNAADGNLNPFPLRVVQATVTLHAPRVVLALVAPERVVSGAVFNLAATLRNLGNAPGVAWLNFTVPNTVELVGDNGTQEPNVAGRRVSWLFPSIPSGGVVFFGISLRAKADSGVESFRLSLDYTDSAGSVPLTAVSNAWPVEFIVPPGQPPIVYVGWALLAALGVAVATFVVAWKRRGPAAVVDEVFVADLSGILLAHRTAGAKSRRDEDVLIAMFKVVQDFVRDAFSEGADEAMSALEFGERKILIERGTHHFIAVIYRGADRHADLAARVKHVSREIDEKFGPILETWSGELETVRGIALLLPQIWRRRRFPMSDRRRAKPRAGHGSEASSPSPPTSGSP